MTKKNRDNPVACNCRCHDTPSPQLVFRTTESRWLDMLLDSIFRNRGGESRWPR